MTKTTDSREATTPSRTHQASSDVYHQPPLTNQQVSSEPNAPKTNPPNQPSPVRHQSAPKPPPTTTRAHPLHGGKWINPELVHDAIGHPTLGGTYPAGRRFSQRLAQKKWLALAVSSPRDAEIGVLFAAGGDTETETEADAGSELENSSSSGSRVGGESEDEEKQGAGWGLLETIPEDQSEVDG